MSAYPAHRVSEKGSEKAVRLTLLHKEAKGTWSSSSTSVSLCFLLMPGSPCHLPGSFCLRSSISQLGPRATRSRVKAGPQQGHQFGICHLSTDGATELEWNS